MDIRHVAVLMLETRSFNCMLGMLYPSDDKFDGLTSTESADVATQVQDVQSDAGLLQITEDQSQRGPGHPIQRP